MTQTLQENVEIFMRKRMRTELNRHKERSSRQAMPC